MHMFTSLTDAEFAAKPRTAFELTMFRDVVAEHSKATEHTAYCCKVAETYRVTLAANKAPRVADNTEPRAKDEAPVRRGTRGSGVSSSGTSRTERMASPAQIQYVQSLMASKEVSKVEMGAWGVMLESGMTFEQAGSIITRLKARKSADGPVRMATDAQLRYVTGLLTTKEHSFGQVDVDTLTFDRVGEMISALKSAPRKAVEKKESSVTDGIYFFEGTYVKVQVAVHGSGYRYTKVFSTETQEWFRKGGLLGKLKPEHKLTEAQAAKFGELYGQCVRCSRTLTNEYSIEHGYGPVCAEAMGF
jgi:hypothetical protein